MLQDPDPPASREVDDMFAVFSANLAMSMSLSTKDESSNRVCHSSPQNLQSLGLFCAI